MATIFINGSPNAGKGNTELFMQQFIQGMGDSPEVFYTANEDPAELAEKLRGHDVLIFMPLYVHAMPGRVMKLFEHMHRAVPVAQPAGHEVQQAERVQRLGFVVQHGFVESANSDYLIGYLRLLAADLGYEYLGTVVKGNAAGTRYIPPRMNGKLFEQLRRLGEHYASTGRFDEEIIRQLGKPHRISKAKLPLYRASSKLFLNNMFWHKLMKHQGGYETRLDKPFTLI